MGKIRVAVVAILLITVLLIALVIYSVPPPGERPPRGSFTDARQVSDTVLKYTFGYFEPEPMFTQFKLVFRINNSTLLICPIAGTDWMHSISVYQGFVDHHIVLYDANGDGKITAGDYLTVQRSSTLEKNTTYEVGLLYSQTGAIICSAEVHIP